MRTALLVVTVLAASRTARADDDGWFAPHRELTAGVDATEEQVGHVVLHDRALEIAAALCRGSSWYELAYAVGVSDGTGAATSHRLGARLRREVFGAEDSGYLVRRYAAWVEAGAGAELLVGRSEGGERRPFASIGVGLDADRSVDEEGEDPHYVGLRLGVRLIAAPGPADAGHAICLGTCSREPSPAVDLGVMVTASVVISP